MAHLIGTNRLDKEIFNYRVAKETPHAIVSKYNPDNAKIRYATLFMVSFIKKETDDDDKRLLNIIRSIGRQFVSICGS